MADYTFLKPPENLFLEGNISENWRMFKQQWNLFKLAADIGSRSQEAQAATFLCIAGLQAQ